MGKSGGNSWLNVVRNAFKSPTKLDREDNDQEDDKKRGKRRWAFLKNCPQETTIQHNVCKARADGNLVAKHARVKSSVTEQRSAAAMASTAAAEAAVATARAAVDILRLNTFASPHFVNLHRAALVIQTIFRGYLARRALMALKGIVKLQAVIRAHIVRKRAKMTLQCIQSLVRVQAHVCDQRRRRSCEATTLGSLFTSNCRRKSLSKNASRSSEYHPRAVEEIQALVQKARECSFKQGKKTLGHVLSQQIWKVDEDQFSDNSYPELVEEGNGYKHRNSNHSPGTPSSTKTGGRNYQSAETPTYSRSIYHHHRMSMSESSYPLPRPHYMAATASAMARVRPHSTPRHRPSSPISRDQTGCSSAKKRLSFPVPDPYNDRANDRHIYSAKKHGDVQRMDVPCYLTE